MTKESLDTYYDELGKTLGEALIEPTRIYVKALKSVKDAGITIKGCSHITGGGFYENVPRMLKEGMGVEIDTKAFPKPPIFDLIQKNKPKNSKSKVNLTLFFAPVGLALMKIYREVFSYPHSLFYPRLLHSAA